MEKCDFLASMKAIGIDTITLIELAYETGLIKRNRLLKPLDLLYAHCDESTNGTVSHNDLAAKIDSNCGVSVSKQAIWGKMDERCEAYFKKILEQIILTKTNINDQDLALYTNEYKRVLIQDSTIIRLPERLFSIFSGVANQSSKVCNARIQGVYDILAETFISFSIDPYSKNDSASAAEIELREGDLVLRDRGYLTLGEVQRHIEHGAHCIYRYKHGMLFLDIKTGEPIDLFDKLKKEGLFDFKVMLNNKNRTIVRITAAPVNDEVANIRRMQSKKHSSHTPSAKSLKMLSWSIYITTIDKEKFDYPTLIKIYKLRWRIEIIFKCWKSNMGFTKIHNVSKSQLYILLYARFIMIIICSQILFRPSRILAKKELDKSLSMLKVTRYLMKNPNTIKEILTELSQDLGSIGPFVSSLARYCSYDKRKRSNYQQELDALFMLS